MAMESEQKLRDLLAGHARDATIDRAATAFGNLVASVGSIIERVADSLAPEEDKSAQKVSVDGSIPSAPNTHTHTWVWTPFNGPGGQYIFCSEEECAAKFTRPKQFWPPYNGPAPDYE